MKATQLLRKWRVRSFRFIRMHPYLLTMAACLSLIFLYPASQESCILPFLSSPMVWIIGGVSLFTVIGIILLLCGKMNDRWTGLLLCAMGVCMRIAYVLATPYYVRQHDVGRFDSDSGHAAYIMYLYQNLHLPDFDVREVWQFYHPPLHHTIAAAWMHLLTALGVPLDYASESVQLLTLGYSCISLVLIWKILKHFRLHGMALAIPLGIAAFHPTFFLLAGSINNDILSITFMLAAILLTLRWFRRPSRAVILKLALVIGLGMMTKLSAWMVAPAAAAAFCMVLYRHRKRPLPLLKQFSMFGTICVPLGLGWGIRNLFKWGVPIAYVPMLSDNSTQYVGNIPIWRRLLDFSPMQLWYVYDCFEMYGQSYNEYNPTIGLLKTAMFGELINPEKFPAIRGFGEILFFSQVLLVILSILAITEVCRRKQKWMLQKEKILLGITAGITLISYYSFCIAYAHTCTQNMRYAVPVIVIGVLFLGGYIQQLKDNSRLKSLLCGTSILFMLASCVVFAIVCR